LPFNKFLIILAQLRHVPLAEGSGKATIENQQYIQFSAIIRKMDSVTLKILQDEIGSGGVYRDSWHRFSAMVEFDLQN
jgi:hypothetical protein